MAAFQSDPSGMAPPRRTMLEMDRDDAMTSLGEAMRVLRAIKADCESTDPDDLVAQRKLVSRIYADVCRVTKVS